MRSLVTGIAGFAGRHLGAHLVTCGDEVWGTVRPRRADSTIALPAGLAGVLDCDVTDPAAVRAAIGRVRPERVYHLAGMAYVPDAGRDPLRAVRVNAEGSLAVAQAIADEAPQARLLLVSSCFVYGGVTLPPARRGVAGASLRSAPAGPIGEGHPTDPTSPYGISKLVAELLVRTVHHERGLDVVVVRAFNHTGPGQRPDFAIPAFAHRIARVERGLEPPVLRVGNLAVERDLTDVRDMVMAYRLALERGEGGAVYNVGRGSGVLISWLLDRLVQRATVPVRIEVDPGLVREGEPQSIVCDPSRFTGLTGWRPATPLVQTLADVLEDARGRVARATTATVGACAVSDPAPA